MQKPEKLGVGDMYTTTIGAKRRPVVICKILKNGLVLSIPLSKTEDIFNLMPFKSRFFGDGFLVKQVITSTYDFAYRNFIGVFDNTKVVKEATRQMKRFYAATL